MIKLNKEQNKLRKKLLEMQKESENEFDDYVLNLIDTESPQEEYKTLIELGNLGIFEIDTSDKNLTAGYFTSLGRCYRWERIKYIAEKLGYSAFPWFLGVLGTAVGSSVTLIFG